MAQNQHKNSKSNLFFLISITIAVMTVGIESEVYAPCFPDILSFFHTSESKVESIISINFIGLAISGLIFGPLSDAYGRRNVALLSLAIFFLSSLGCLMAGTIDSMIIFRFIQGLGSGAIFTIGAASYYDRYDGEYVVRLLGLLNGIITAAMAGAPILGSFMNNALGWRSTFALVAVLSTISLVLCYFFFNESHPPEKRIPFSMKSLIVNYGSLCANFKFVANSSIFALLYASLLVYVSNLSLIFVNNLQVSSVTYSYYHASILGTFMAFSFLSSKVAKVYGINVVKNLGVVLFVVGACALLTVGYLFPYSPALITVTMAVLSAGVGLSLATFYTNAVVAAPKICGAANAFASSLRMGACSFFVALSAYNFSGAIRPVAIINFLLIVVAILFFLALAMQKEPETASKLSPS